MNDVPSSESPPRAEPDQPAPGPRMSPVRRAAGAGCLVLAVLLLPASVAGVANPWRYVMLRRYLGNPLQDAAMIALFAVLAIWLLAPVRSEAAQHGRVMLRWAAVAVFLVTLICWGGFGSLFSPGKVQTVGRFGDLQAVVETHGEDSEIRIWAGRGLAVRDMGRLGKACGPVSASFPSRAEVQISTNYGDFRLPLDPRTGRPLRELGPTCTG